MEPLTLEESQDFIACESIVEKGINHWLKVSDALLRICEKKYYQIEYKTFREYCLKKWSISDQHARRLMDAGEVVKSLPKSEPAGSLSQSAALALKPVPVEDREFVLADATATSSGPPAAPAIKAAAIKRNPPAVPAAGPPEPEHRETQDALVDAMADNERLTRENDALAATDQGKQIAKMNEELGALRGRINSLLTSAKVMEKDLKYFRGICDRLRELLGVAKASEIYKAVEMRKV